MNRKEFILAGTAAALMPKVFAAEKPSAENDWGVVPDGIRVRFMGTATRFGKFDVHRQMTAWRSC